MDKQVDLIIHYDLANASKHAISHPDGELVILDIDSLIVMKKTSGRDQDLADVSAL